MKLKRLYIRNFKGIKEVEIDFMGPSGPRQLTCLIGDNGAGKTTVLQAISYYFSMIKEPVTKKMGISWNGILTERISSLGDTHVEMDFIFSDSEVNLINDIFQKWVNVFAGSDNLLGGGPKFNGNEIQIKYELGKFINPKHADSSYRLLIGRELVEVVSKSRPALRDEFISLGDIFWFTQYRNHGSIFNLDEEERGKGAGRELGWFNSTYKLTEILVKWWSYHTSPQKAGYTDYIAVLEKYFKILFPDISFMGSMPGPGQYDATPLNDWYFMLKDSEREYDIAEMSSGEQAIFSILFEFVRRNIIQSESIILIDELELHLHPPQQQALLTALPKIGPDCQFIITTHSDYLSNAIPSEFEVHLEGGRTCK